MVWGWADTLVIILFIGPYIALGILWLYEHSEFGWRRHVKSLSEELIQLLIDVDPTYFKDTIETWLEIHGRRIENDRII